jgi:hypothetical protein
MSNQLAYERWGLLSPESERKIESGWKWSIELDKIYWQEIIDKLVDLENIFRLPTADELLAAYSEETSGFTNDIYWSATSGLDVPNLGMLGLIMDFPTTVSSQYSLVVDFRNGDCHSSKKGVLVYDGEWKYSSKDKEGRVICPRYKVRLLEKMRLFQ